MRFSLGVFATLLSLGGALASNVLELTPDNWEENIGKGKPALIELYVNSLLRRSLYAHTFASVQLRTMVRTLQGKVPAITPSRDAWLTKHVFTPTTIFDI